MIKKTNKQSSKGKNSPNINGDVSGSRFGDEIKIYSTDFPFNKAREVKTILNLICLITKKSSNINVSPNKGFEKNLKKKIDDRFKTYKNELLSEFTKLNTWHGDSYSSALCEAGLSDIQIDKIAEYLRRESEKHLNDASENPIKALNSLTDFFDKSLSSEEKRMDYEIVAIRFYLFKQLINCNVFPNPEGL